MQVGMTTKLKANKRNLKAESANQFVKGLNSLMRDRETDKKTDRQSEERRDTDKQTDRDREIERQIDGQKHLLLQCIGRQIIE